jgi:hypothetical protein
VRSVPDDIASRDAARMVLVLPGAAFGCRVVPPLTATDDGRRWLRCSGAIAERR